MMIFSPFLKPPKSEPFLAQKMGSKKKTGVKPPDPNTSPHVLEWIGSKEIPETIRQFSANQPGWSYC